MIKTEINFVTDMLQTNWPNSEYVVGVTYETLEWLSKDQNKPTKAEWDTALASSKAEYDAQEYARNRQAEYPTIAELTVALYDTDDKADIEAKRAAVKAKFPKP